MANETAVIPLPSWVGPWTRGELPMTLDLLGIRAWDPASQALARRFPPGCVVRGLRDMRLPAPGQVAIVVGTSACSRYLVVLSTPYVDKPEALLAECTPESLEVVAYVDGVTPAVVASILDRMSN